MGQKPRWNGRRMNVQDKEMKMGRTDNTGKNFVRMKRKEQWHLDQCEG